MCSTCRHAWRSRNRNKERLACYGCQAVERIQKPCGEGWDGLEVPQHLTVRPTIAQSGNSISGDVPAIIVVQTNSGYAPDPDYSKLPPFDELVRLAFGEHGVIRDRNHPIYRELFGAPPIGKTGNGSDL